MSFQSKLEFQAFFPEFEDKNVRPPNYRAFHGFGQAKFPNVGSVLGSSQFSILPPAAS